MDCARTAGAFMVFTWILLLITALFMVFKAVQPQTEVSVKKFYFLNAFICGVATYSYFAMFSGMGWETIEGCRQFFYIR
jgi:bacteriorhodopsin